MLVNREKLENELRVVIAEFTANKKVKKEVGEYFVSKGMFEAEALNIFAQRTSLEMLNDLILGVFTMACYSICGCTNINPEKYFTELELQEIKGYEISKKDNKKFPIVFKDVKQLSETQWYTDLTIREVADLYDRRVPIYNSKTQRQLKTVKHKGSIINKIDVKRESVNDIKKHFFNGTFFSNFITFNIREDGTEEFGMHDNNLRMTAGNLDIIDGFHRCVAFREILLERPDIEFKTGIMITHFDIEKAQQYIVQEDKRNKIDTKYINSLNLESKSNTIVKKINESSKSHLKGKITTDKNRIKLNDSLIMFDVLSDSIDLIFKPKENIDVVNYSKYIIEGLNSIIENNTELLTNVQDEKIWVAYIIILGELYKQEDWEDKLILLVDDINIDDVEYKSINGATINRLKKELILNV